MGSETTQWTFQSGGSTHLVTITADGRVIRNPDVTWDEAALCFWEAVERVRQAATHTPTADGEARLDEALQILSNALYVAKGEGFVEQFDTLGVIRDRLRARPALPADVQAVVERVSDALTIVHPIEDLARLHYDSPTHPTENVALYAPIAMEYVSVGDLRTLLAHLTRQDTP